MTESVKRGQLRLERPGAPAGPPAVQYDEGALYKWVCEAAPTWARHLKNAHAREDVIVRVAESVIERVRKGVFFNTESELAQYVAVAVQNRCADARKAEAARFRNEQFCAEEQEEKWQERSRPDVELERRETISRVQAGVDALRGQGGVYVVAHYVEGKTRLQVAAEQRVSRKTVDSGIQRALPELRTTLADYNPTLPGRTGKEKQ